MTTILRMNNGEHQIMIFQRTASKEKLLTRLREIFFSACI